jgi:hypothetical protein
MPSSISSSDRAVIDTAQIRAGFVRLTASDRPGVAQPVPERDIPARPWRAIFLGMLLLFALLIGAWEMYWRAFGATPALRNSDGAWAEQRRRIDNGEGDKTVLTGASRVLFDVQLPVWQRIAGERPIQLALEGTSPIPVLEDLAADPAFNGRVLVGVAPDVFFSGFAYRGSALRAYHKQGPSQRSGHWLSKHLIEPYFAFYDPDFALATVLARQPWPKRAGLHEGTRVRKLLEQGEERNSWLWPKVEHDADYRALARRIWAEDFTGPLPGMATPEAKRKLIDEQIDKAAAAIGRLRARGVEVLFLRPPSSGDYYAYEQKYLPRAESWDRLLARTGVRGIHFEDYPELQGYDLPEWSHMSRAEAERFTAALVPIIRREFRAPASPPGSASRP